MFNPELEKILEGCRKGNRKYQQALYKLFYSYGMSVGIRYVNSENEAISILNDSFLKVYSRIKKYDSSRDFKPWFRKIVVNTAIDYVKKENRLRMKTDSTEGKEIIGREEILSRIGYQELMAMVQSLSSSYRTVFNLYVIDGFKHEEIATMLGINVGTSKSNLYKARHHLKRMVTENLKVNKHG